MSVPFLKSKRLQSVFIFFLLNMILFGFLILYANYKPTRLEISLLSDKPALIHIYNSTWTERLDSAYGNVDKIQKIVFNLRRDADINSIRIDFGMAPQKFEIHGIVFIKPGNFRYVVPLDELKTLYPKRNQIKAIHFEEGVLYLETSGNDGYVVPDPSVFESRVVASFSPNGKWLLVVLLSQIIIILCSLSRVRHFLHLGLERITAGDLRPPRKRKENLLYSGYTAFIVSLVLAIFFPLHIYFQTREYFHFTFWDFLLDCAILFFIFLAPLFLSLLLSRRVFGFLPHLLLLATLLYFALETGILSYRLPILDGNLENYGHSGRMMLDSAIGLGLLLAPFSFYKALRERIFLFGLLVSILSGVLLFHVQTNDDINSPGLIIPSTIPREKVVQNLGFADKKNVIVLIVDSISTEVVEDIFKNHPELKAKMPGFVHFTNNVGMHIQTSVALPGIFSGEYFSNPANLPAYTKKVYSPSSFLKRYLDMDSLIYVSLLLPDFSYTNSLSDMDRAQGEPEILKTFDKRMEGMFPWNIREYYIFKIAPYLFKKPILTRFTKRWEVRGGEVRINDEIVYDRLAKAPVDKSISGTLHVHQVIGGHPPFLFDADGKQIQNPRSGYQAYYDRVYFEFKRLSSLFDKLRERELYEDAFIVIMGDHATPVCHMPKSTQVPNNAFPAIMLKNRDAKGEFVISRVPTSVSKFAEMMKQISDKNLTNAEIERILRCDRRLYRQGSENNISDWIIDPDYNVAFEQTELIRDPLKLRPLNADHTYKFRSFNNENYPDFIANNGYRTSGVGLDFHARGELIFRMPKPNSRYSLHFNIKPFSGKSRVYEGSYHLISDHFKTKYIFKSGEDVVLPGILTDDNGIVRLLIEPIDANYSLCFTTILVKEAY